MGRDNNLCQSCLVKNIGLCEFENGENNSAFCADEHFAIRHGNAVPGDIIFDEFSLTDSVYILKSGWVSIFHLLADGSRQILRFVLPGEIFGVELTEALLHSNCAEAITPASYCQQPKSAMRDLRHLNVHYSERFIELLNRERQIMASGLANIGRRESLARVAYLLAELAVRSSHSYPLAAGVDYRVPLVQRMIADATGLTIVHVNRTLMRLRSEGYLDFHDGRLTVLHSARLDQLMALSPAEQFSLEQLAKII